MKWYCIRNKHDLGLAWVNGRGWTRRDVYYSTYNEVEMRSMALPDGGVWWELP